MFHFVSLRFPQHCFNSFLINTAVIAKWHKHFKTATGLDEPSPCFKFKNSTHTHKLLYHETLTWYYRATVCCLLLLQRWIEWTQTWTQTFKHHYTFRKRHLSCPILSLHGEPGQYVGRSSRTSCYCVPYRPFYSVFFNVKMFYNIIKHGILCMLYCTVPSTCLDALRSWHLQQVQSVLQHQP